LNDYATVCVDVYSRYVKARSIPNREKEEIAKSIYYLITIMGKPNIISADNEIIDALYKDGILYIEIDGIKLYRTSPHELNKNAIVESMIKTLKQYLINIFMTYKTQDLINNYNRYKLEYTKLYPFNFSFVDYLLEIVCEINNNKEHRIIKAIPTNVFNELELNKQKVNYIYYPFYKVGTIVIKKPESKGAFSYKLFNFDPEPYVISNTIGRKYGLIKLIDLVEGNMLISRKHYQPYEIRAFTDGREFLTYLTSDLIKNSLIRLYGEDRYNKIVQWFKPITNKYTESVI
jgi:hypothetical protein